MARLTELEGMTMTGMLVGTPEYMAPEQMRGGTGDNPIAISIGHAQDPVPAPKQFRPHLSNEWPSFLLRVLAKSPSDWFSTADEMREAMPPV